MRSKLLGGKELNQPDAVKSIRPVARSKKHKNKMIKPGKDKDVEEFQDD